MPLTVLSTRYTKKKKKKIFYLVIYEVHSVSCMADFCATLSNIIIDINLLDGRITEIWRPERGEIAYLTTTHILF